MKGLFWLTFKTETLEWTEDTYLLPNPILNCNVYNRFVEVRNPYKIVKTPSADLTFLQTDRQNRRTEGIFMSMCVLCVRRENYTTTSEVEPTIHMNGLNPIINYTCKIQKAKIFYRDILSWDFIWVVIRQRPENLPYDKKNYFVSVLILEKSGNLRCFTHFFHVNII